MQTPQWELEHVLGIAFSWYHHSCSRIWGFKCFFSLSFCLFNKLTALWMCDEHLKYQRFDSIYRKLYANTIEMMETIFELLNIYLKITAPTQIYTLTRFHFINLNRKSICSFEKQSIREAVVESGCWEVISGAATYWSIQNVWCREL